MWKLNPKIQLDLQLKLQKTIIIQNLNTTISEYQNLKSSTFNYIHTTS